MGASGVQAGDAADDETDAGGGLPEGVTEAGAEVGGADGVAGDAVAVAVGALEAEAGALDGARVSAGVLAQAPTRSATVNVAISSCFVRTNGPQ